MLRRPVSEGCSRVGGISAIAQHLLEGLVAFEALVLFKRQQQLEEGFARMSIEAVAKVAGVGKPAIYRRFADKPALVASVISRQFLPTPKACEQPDLKAFPLLGADATALSQFAQ